MKTINKLFIMVTLIALVWGVTGCAPSANGGGAEKSKTTYRVCGSINFEADALPSQFLVQNITGAREATSSFSKTGHDASYTIKAFKGEPGKTDNEVFGTVTTTTTAVNYSIEVPSKGNWTIIASFLSNEEVLATGQSTITISDENFTTPFSKDISISVSPEIDATSTGSISLKIKNQSANVKSITWHWELGSNSDEDLEDDTKTVTQNGVAQFDFDSVSAVRHTVKLLFKNAAGKTLYACTETINIFPGWTTDTWSGSNAYITEQNEFVYTDQVAANFTSVSRIEAGDTIYALWSDRSNDKRSGDNFIAEYDTIDYTVVPAQNQKGVELFTSIQEGATITNPLPEEIGPNFCMDGTIIYAPPYKFIQSYAGYVKDPSFDLRTISQPLGSGITQTSFPGNCLILDGYLYYIQNVPVSNQTVPCIQRCKLDDPNNTFIRSPLTVSLSGYQINSFAVMHEKNDDGTVDASKGIFYLACYDGSHDTVIRRIPFTTIYNENENVWQFYHDEFNSSIPEGNNKAATLSLSMLTYYSGLYFSPVVGDMKIIGDKLYVLLFDSSLSSGIYKSNGYPIDSYSGIICNGGIIKFDISSTANKDEDSLFPINWASGNAANANNLVLGLYADPFPKDEDETYYFNSSCSSDYQIPFTNVNNGQPINWVLPTQPPLTSDGKANPSYFYGPRKILASSNNQLVIVDDGGYIQKLSEQDKDHYTSAEKLPINRVVTVDLQQEAITSTVDVGATFSASFVTPYFDMMMGGSSPGNYFAPYQGPGD